MNSQPIILVLDDERPQLLAVRATLSRIGQIKEFLDPQAALGYLREHRVEVAIVDVHMPRYLMNGMDFIRTVREFDPDVSIIVRTADDSAELADEAIASRAFRRAVKHKTSPSQLQQLVVDAAEETLARRRMTSDAAGVSEVRTQLAETLGSMEDEATVAEGYRTLFQNITNQLTAIAGTTEMIDREVAESGASLVRMLSAKNKLLVERLVQDVAKFLDAPLADRIRAIGAPAHTSANGVLEALRTRVVADSRWAATPKEIRVSFLPQDLYVAVSALKLITALRHLLEFCLLRASEGASVSLGARYLEKMAPVGPDSLAFNLRPSALVSPQVAFMVNTQLEGTSLEDIRGAIESGSENLRTANLQMIGLALGDDRVAAVVNRDIRGVTTFEIFLPLAR